MAQPLMTQPQPLPQPPPLPQLQANSFADAQVNKCEFIKLNAPEEAWASTDDGAGLLVKVVEQDREVLVRAARFRTSPLLCSPQLSPDPCASWI